MPRDASGNYTLPAGNPVVTGTVITSTWANPTMSDIANEITNSLSRNGQGGMLAPLFFADGTINNPSIAFTLETGLGLYRSAAGILNIAGLGKDVAEFDGNTGFLWLKAGNSPALRLQPDAIDGNPVVGMYDAAGNFRYIIVQQENNGDIFHRRYDVGGTVITQLKFEDNGNVSVTPDSAQGVSVPDLAENLTRKDYVDSVGVSSFDDKLAGYAADGQHTRITGDIDLVLHNSHYVAIWNQITNGPADFGAGRAVLKTDMDINDTEGSQWLFGMQGTGVDWVAWTRPRVGSVWGAWKKVVDGGAFTQRLAGYADTGLHEGYSGDLNLILENSLYTFDGVSVTNAPTDLTSASAFVSTMMWTGNTYGTQVIYGMDSVNAFKQWMRTLTNSVWGAWKLVVDGGAFTQRLAGYEDTGLHTEYTGDLNDIAINSTYTIVANTVTNEPPDFTSSNRAVLTTFMRTSASGQQILYGEFNLADAHKQWMRNLTGGVWEAWKLVVDGDAHLVGEIKIWPVNNAPAGYLRCEGQAVSRTTYADLFTVLAGTYGNGDGTTTFNLPDYRGQFMRGWDIGAGTDPNAATRTDRGDGVTGDQTGTKQADDFESHIHSVANQQLAFGGAGGNTVNGISAAINTAATGGDETRPVNVYVNYIIRT